ncbi:hypothetical protein JCM6882_008521 [Rhodosporidiobolus microsporus]
MDSLLAELESYIAFFKRRQELEQEYTSGLQKLSKRAEQSDRQLDEEHPSQLPPSWRKAWLAVRNAVEDEARAHKQAADGLGKIVAGLNTLRDNRDRTRRRIQDDKRSAASEYSDYKSVVSRLRKTYERKVEELQHHEEAEALKEEERPAASSAATGARGGAGGNGAKEEPWPPEHWSSNAGASEYVIPTPAYLRKRSDSAASSKGGAVSDAESSPPQSVISPAPTPVFVSGATSAATGEKSGPYRDPPTGKQNVFEAIAKRDWSGDKHRVNSIVRAVGNLAKGTDPAVALGPSRGARSRQYGGKLKREAEQADRDYRAGVFALETLRLQKMRVQTSARESLHEFVLELAVTLKNSFGQRVTDQISLGQSVVAIGEHVKPEIGKIEAERDAEQFFATIQDSAPQEPPVYYVNAFVGECRTLLFGVSLQDYHAKHPALLVPLIVQRCITNVDSHGLDNEGIYRVPGKLATIQQIVTRMEKDEEAFSFGPNDDPPAVAGVLKLYLRQLPIPLFPFSAADRKSFTADLSASPETATAALIRRLRRLSRTQQATLKTVCEHLARVVEREQVNKMSASNLALIFSTVIFGEDEAATLESAMHASKDVVMELLITQHTSLFDGLPAEAPAPVRSRRPSASLATLSPPLPSSSEPSSAPSSQVSGNGSAQSSPPSSKLSPGSSPQPNQSSPRLPTSAAMRNAGSIDSVYALYQRASSPGFLPSYSSDSSPEAPTTGFVHPPRLHPPTSIAERTGTAPFQQAPTFPLARAPPSHSAPQLSPMSERSLDMREADLIRAQSANEGEQGPPLPPPRTSSHSVHDLSSPSPPLSAALGRRIPSPEH